MDKSEQRSISEAISMGMPCAKSEWFGTVLYIRCPNIMSVGIDEIANLSTVIGKRVLIESSKNGLIVLRADCRSKFQKVFDYVNKIFGRRNK